jgi:hypothetical protein
LESHPESEAISARSPQWWSPASVSALPALPLAPFLEVDETLSLRITAHDFYREVTGGMQAGETPKWLS